MSQLISRVLLTVKKYFFRLVLFSLIFGAAFCTFCYTRSSRSASVILAFTYPNASDGLYPNGTYFNAYNILTEEVLQKGIQNAGLTGRVSPTVLAEEITIRPRSDASLITTQYVVTYQAGKEDALGAVSAEGLLSSVMYAYIQHFHDTYSNDQVVLNLDMMEDEDLEYMDRVNYFNVALNQLQKYLSAQQVNDKDFISSDGTSFQDLINIVERYRTTSLKEIKSIITERGIAHSRSQYTQRLNYRIWNLGNTYEYNRKMQQLYKKIIEEYEAKLTSVVFIPALDSQREFYMSKTKIGIDIHALSATDYEEKAEEVQRQIKQTDQYIDAIAGTGGASAAISAQRVDRLIESLEQQLDATMEQVRQVEKEYSRYKNRNYVTVKPVNSGFMERIGIKKGIVLTGALDVVLVLYLALRPAKRKGGEPQ